MRQQIEEYGQRSTDRLLIRTSSTSDAGGTIADPRFRRSLNRDWTPSGADWNVVRVCDHRQGIDIRVLERPRRLRRAAASAWASDHRAAHRGVAQPPAGTTVGAGQGRVAPVPPYRPSALGAQPSGHSGDRRRAVDRPATPRVGVPSLMRERRGHRALEDTTEIVRATLR